MAGMATSRPMTVQIKPRHAGRHRRDAGPAGVGNAREGLHHAPHRPEQPDERPPATAVESTIIPFSSPMASAAAASSITTFIASKEAGLTRCRPRGPDVGVPWPRARVIIDRFDGLDRHGIVLEVVFQFVGAADI